MLIAFPHGAESLALNKDTAKRLAAFEGEVLKRMFRGIKMSECWRRLYNKELTF
jgi:ribosomal protein L19